MARRWVSREAALLRTTTGETDPVAAIIGLARGLLDEAGCTDPPFNPAMLASFRNVREIRRRQMVSAARLVPEHNALVIEVNQDHSQGKQNFSADHEVIHTLIPTYGNRIIEDAETGTFASASEEEMLCDIGAAELLLDARRLGPHAMEAGPSLRSLTVLSELYGASLQATARHLAQLGIWSCALVFWEEDYRKNERVPEAQALLPGLALLGRPKPKMRVKNVYRSPSFTCFIPRNKSVDDTSLVAACCEGNEAISGLEEYPFGVTSVHLYGEHYYVPYWRGGVLTRRVVSILLLPPSRNTQMSVPQPYQAEFL